MPKTAKNERAKEKLEEKIKGRLELPIEQGWGSRFTKWMQRNFTSIVLPVLAIIVLIGGIYLYTSQRGAPVVPSQELDAELGLDIGKGQISKPTEQPKAQPEPSKQEPKQELGLGGPAKELPETFTLQAQKGDGITHLARKALRQYLELAPDKPNLSPEHKIYIEDYIQNQTGSYFLELGQELSFPTSLIEEAITASQTLTQAQLNNLTKYVQLVPSL